MLARQLKRKTLSRYITYIKDEKGKDWYTSVDIAEKFRQYYESLYNLNRSDTTPTDNAIQDYLAQLGLPKITSEQKDDLDAPFTLSETLNAIKSLKGGKAPGPDGFGNESNLTIVSSIKCCTFAFNNRPLPRVILEPPHPTGTPVQILDQWEVYEDSITGRKYYVHSNSRERSWKPPRSLPPKQSATIQDQPEIPNEKFFSPVKITGVVQLRVKNSNTQYDRQCQTKSMVLDSGEGIKPISRHRRNHSQHYLPDNLIPKDILVNENKEGFLNKTKITDKGKKLRKNWGTSYIVLCGRKLEFYKESKEQALLNLKSGTKPEGIDLCGAHIEWTKEKSSRKNVFQITTVSGNEFLFQSDSDIAISEWFCAIKNMIDSLAKQQPFPLLNVNIQRSSSNDVLRIGADLKEQKTEQRKSLVLKLNYSASDGSDKSRVKTRLKKFISRRPSLKTLQEKGLIKDQVFGCHLETLCKRENTTVPYFVKLCIDAVEKRGLDADGIYRVSGNLSTIQKLRFVVNQEEKLNLDDSQWEDVHVVTGALKMFFRELPEPLFPFCFFEQFVEAIKIQDNDLRCENYEEYCEKLPTSNHDTMKTLFEHLRKIVINASVNLMSTQSLGIVFGPTLLRPENDTGNMAFRMVYQNQIVELLLTEFKNIFV
ncbi:rho GTPase-activating protein 15 [Bombina bombina]|uniref:rho GTPase-activating protein 15 n=1 Tax=Bombina bombina TaxID=8345 RepID=UPI00235A8EF8|nr:rho GTPase-activating protein 15 [Bombina bombina]